VADDLRPPLGPIFTVFGVPATVTRPASAPILTTGIWVPMAAVDSPDGADFGRRETQRVMAFRRETQRVMAFRRDDVPTIPKGTIVLAPDVTGGPVLRFVVDGPEHADREIHQVYLTPDPE